MDNYPVNIKNFLKGFEIQHSIEDFSIRLIRSETLHTQLLILNTPTTKNQGVF